MREAVQRYPDLKLAIVSRLLEIFGTIHSVEVHRSTLWILGEYCTEVSDITRVVAEIRTSLGEVRVGNEWITGWTDRQWMDRWNGRMSLCNF